ncbi:MAG: hypothetical protein Q4E83_03835 [bacterium]|nr:hypothetical protein [bacterium]
MSKRKELVSISLEPKNADIIRQHSNNICRSFSETIRLIVDEYIKTNNLEKKYAKK